MRIALVALLGALALAGCATIVKGTTQVVAVTNHAVSPSACHYSYERSAFFLDLVSDLSAPSSSDAWRMINTNVGLAPQYLPREPVPDYRVTR